MTVWVVLARGNQVAPAYCRVVLWEAHLGERPVEQRESQAGRSECRAGRLALTWVHRVRRVGG